MINPIEVEQRFRSLMEILSYPSSGREKLKTTYGFLESIVDEFARNESYVLELCQQLPSILSTTSFIGYDPAEVYSMFSMLARVEKTIPSVRDLKGFSEALEQLRQGAVLQHAFSCEWETVLRLFDDTSITPNRPWLREIDASEQESPLNYLRKVILAARESGETRSASIVEGILERWHPNRSDFAGVVPVVERHIFEDTTTTDSGTLRRIDLRILGNSSSGCDDIRLEVLVFGAESAAAQMIDTPVSAARELLKEQSPHLTKRFVEGRIVLEDQHALHQGLSASLAFAVLVYCAILRHCNQRTQYTISPTVALTGDIDEHGYVLPVNTGGLKAKVRAAFFSWVECLVVPEEQLADAEKELSLLHDVYPHRRLSLIGVSQLREIFFDRRITQRTQIPLLQHTAQTMWQRRLPIALAVIVVLLVMISSMLYGPLDKNPVAYKFDGEMLYVKNKHDQVVDKIRVGKRTVEEANQQIDPTLADLIQFVAFADVDRDGVNEIIWIQEPMGSTGILTVIKCKSVREDSVRWEFPLRYSIRFPHKEDIVGSEWSTNKIIADDFDHDGIPEVIAVAGFETFFPQLIIRINGKTGMELNHYLHTGGINACIPIDLDGDGNKELLLSGINNALRNACVIVLDPKIMSGHSPSSEDYAVEGFGAGTERAYIRIPRTVVGDQYTEQVKYNQAVEIEVAESSKTFSVRIVDFWIPNTLRKDILHARLVGHFGFDLSAQSFGTFDDFDLQYEYLLKQGRIPAVKEFDYLRQYAKTIQYWDGVGWQNHPVKNIWYEEALKKLTK